MHGNKTEMTAQDTIKKHPLARLMVVALLQWICISGFLCTYVICHPAPGNQTSFDTEYIEIVETALLFEAKGAGGHDCCGDELCEATAQEAYYTASGQRRITIPSSSDESFTHVPDIRYRISPPAGSKAGAPNISLFILNQSFLC